LCLGLPPWSSPFHFGLLDLRHSVRLLGGGGVISSSQDLYLYAKTEKCTHTQTLNLHALSGIRTQDPGFRASDDTCLRPLDYRDRHFHRNSHKFGFFRRCFPHHSKYELYLHNIFFVKVCETLHYAWAHVSWT
jgi:hypothetical protein